MRRARRQQASPGQRIQVGQQEQQHQGGTHHCRRHLRAAEQHRHRNAADGCHTVDQARHQPGGEPHTPGRRHCQLPAAAQQQGRAQQQHADQQAQRQLVQPGQHRNTERYAQGIAQHQPAQPRPVGLAQGSAQQRQAGQHLQHKNRRHHLGWRRKQRQPCHTQRRKAKAGKAAHHAGCQYEQQRRQQQGGWQGR